MPKYEFKGQPVQPKSGWVVINNTRMKLSEAMKVTGFKEIADQKPAPRTPTPEELATQHIEAVREQVTRRISDVASRATQINLAAAMAGGILDDVQSAAYLAGLKWISDMRTTGKQMITTGDQDFANDLKWPVLPDNVRELIEAF